MPTSVIRIKQTTVDPDPYTTYACTHYWFRENDGGDGTGVCVITQGETATIDSATLADHVATGLVEEVVA